MHGIASTIGIKVFRLRENERKSCSVHISHNRMMKISKSIYLTILKIYQIASCSNEIFQFNTIKSLNLFTETSAWDSHSENKFLHVCPLPEFCCCRNLNIIHEPKIN